MDINNRLQRESRGSRSNLKIQSLGLAESHPGTDRPRIARSRLDTVTQYPGYPVPGYPGIFQREYVSILFDRVSFRKPPRIS
eukprot:2145905-Rhodomonas_salina.1